MVNRVQFGYMSVDNGIFILADEEKNLTLKCSASDMTVINPSLKVFKAILEDCDYDTVFKELIYDLITQVVWDTDVLALERTKVRTLYKSNNDLINSNVVDSIYSQIKKDKSTDELVELFYNYLVSVASSVDSALFNKNRYEVSLDGLF